MYVTLMHSIIDYFSASCALLNGSDPTTPKSFHTFATSTTAFHIALKPLLCLTVVEAALKYKIPDLIPAFSAFVMEQNRTWAFLNNIQLQIWHSVHVQ